MTNVEAAHDVVVATPPPTRSADAVDDRHGMKVRDSYRWLEVEGREQSDWLAAQDSYARTILRELPGSEAVRRQLREANRGVERVEVVRVVGDAPRVFSLRRGANDESPVLVVRDGWSGQDRVLVDPGQRADGGSHASIDSASPSPDGRYVAYAIARGGSENATIEVMDVESGRVLPDRIDHTLAPIISWRSDGRSFFYWRRGKRSSGAAATEYLKDGATYLHTLGGKVDGVAPVIGAGMSKLGLGTHDYTTVEVSPGSSWVMARVVPTAAKFSFFVAPLRRVRPGKTPWRRVARIEDGVEAMVLHEDRAYAFTSRGAPNYRVVSFDLRTGSLAQATDFVPESDVVLQDFAAAQDALYVVTLDHGVNRLLRVPWKGSGRAEVSLPFAGSITKIVGDTGRPGLIFSMEGWTEPARWFRVDPATGTAVDLRLTPPANTTAELVAERMTVRSRDGAEVPISVLRRKDARRDGTAPALLYAYGAYGTVVNPTFNPFTLVWVRMGGIYAICHVRGGSELGSSWHLDGIRQKKENGVDDFIACAEHLGETKYSRAQRLTALGTSAGGIVIGGAITKRPELFSAAVVRVGTLNLLRVEVTAGGPVHAEEFGDPNVAADFRSLLASDPYHRVRDGVAYPAVLLTTGRHDPRVPAWMPGEGRSPSGEGAPEPRERDPLLFQADAGPGSEVHPAIFRIGSLRAQVRPLWFIA